MAISQKRLQQSLISQKGSASLLVIFMSVSLLSITCALALLAQVFLQQRQSETAADLAALAGAKYVLQGEQTACANARIVAGLNRTELLDCKSDVSSISVVIGQRVHSVTLSRLLPFVTARAKAGY